MDEFFHIQWHITNFCNLRCKHCYQDDFSNKSDLNLTDLKKISDNFTSTLEKWAKRACIHLTGGEPLLKKELFPLLEYLNQNPWISELGIITNGLLLDHKIIHKFSEFPKLKKIKISLDGATPETNDLIRNEKTFSKVIENLLGIINYKNFEIFLMFTVMKKNLGDLTSFFELSKNLGVHGFIIERFIPLGEGKKFKDEVLTKEDWEKLIQILLEIFSIDDKNLFLTFQAFQVRFNNLEPELLGAPCVIGKDGLCIMPEGDVFPCRRFPITIGNLLKMDLINIWQNSELLRSLKNKKYFKGKCKKCKIENCYGCRSLAFSLTGDPFGEDPHCWYEF